jgi:hypothetical protein
VAALAPTSALLGRDIVGNFFFPQLFGTCCVFGVAVLWARVNLSAAAEVIASVLVTFAFGWLYPVAAMQFAAFALACQALALLQTWRSSGRLPFRPLFLLVAMVVGTGAAVMLHPRFRAAVQLAQPEGGISLRVPTWSVLPLSIALLLLALVLAIALVRQRLTLRSGRAFVALCAAIGGIAIAQQAAFYIFGLGSRYIMAKHIFAVSTLLVAAAAVTVTHLLNVGASQTMRPGIAALARFAFVPATLLAFGANYLPFGGERIARLMRVEATLRDAVRQRPELAGHTIMAAGPQLTRFIFTHALLGVPISPAAAISLTKDAPAYLRREDALAQLPVEYAVVARREVRAPECIVSTPLWDALAIVRYPCQFESDPAPPSR